MIDHSKFHSADPSRRKLLKGFAAGAAAILPAGAVLAQAQKGASKLGRIDVHHHMLPPFQANMTARQYTPQASLDAMDKFGTEQAILSLTVAAEYLYDGSEKANKFAREANEYGAKAMQMNPRRLGFFAALPGRNIDASLKEIEYVLRHAQMRRRCAVHQPGRQVVGRSHVRADFR